MTELEPEASTAVPVTAFARGDIVRVRHYKELCRVLDVVGPAEGFCVPVVVVGLLSSKKPDAWVEPIDLALVARPSDDVERGQLAVES